MFRVSSATLMEWSFGLFLIPMLLPIISVNLLVYNLFILLSFFLFLCAIFLNRKVDILIFLAFLISLGVVRVLHIGEWQLNYSFLTSVFIAFQFLFPLFWLSHIASQGALREQISFKKIKSWYQMLLIVTLLTTIIGNLRYNIPSRFLATSTLDSSLKNLYRMQNIGSFGFSYLLLFMVPLFLYLYKNSRLKRYLLLFSLTVLCAIETQYTSLILLLLPATVLSYTIGLKAVTKVFVILFSLLPSIVVYLNLDAIFNHLIRLFSNYASVQIRIVEIYRLLTNSSDLGSDIGERQRLYQMSLESFSANPLYGARDPLSVGGHSQVLDLLGSSGLVGVALVLLLVLIFTYLLSGMSRRVPKTGKTILQLNALLFVVLSIINPVFTSTQLGLVIPISYIFIYSLGEE